MTPPANPHDKELIAKIGDQYFWICDEEVDECYRHPEHPHTIRIRDCEDETVIDVTSSLGLPETREAAKALVELLNGVPYDVAH